MNFFLFVCSTDMRWIR